MSDTPIPAPPPPLDPSVQRYTPDGRPTIAQVEYERRLYAWQRAIVAAVTALMEVS